MTNTPRTDANCWDITEGRFRDEYTSVVKSEFARELELENEAMKELLYNIYNEISIKNNEEGCLRFSNLLQEIYRLIPGEISENV